MECFSRAAQDEGAFDNLPGKGRALNLDDDEGLADDLRLAFKVLKNAGCLPPEMELRKELFSIRQLMNAAIDEPTRIELRRELQRVTLKLEMLNSVTLMKFAREFHQRHRI
jgi:hypothetical protein